MSDEFKHRFYLQMEQAHANLGTELTLKCLGQMICYIAQQNAVEINYDCDFGKLSFTPKHKPTLH